MPRYENGTTTAEGTPTSSEWPSLIEAAPVAAPASDRAVTNQRRAHRAAQLRQAVREDGAYLVPLRLFVGLGWLRACAEKIMDPGWRDGSSLATFLSGHVSAGDVAFPWYETLIAQVFLPHAAPLALLILLGQFLAGMAIAVGGLTNAALLGGLFMNLNFLLAGAPNPSTFYIVIQVALLLTNAGAILGLDARLARDIHKPLLVAQPLAERCRCRWRAPMLPIGTISLITAVYSLAYITDWSPAGSVEDPAMIVAILALLTPAWATIAWLRQDDRGRRALRERDTRSRPRQELDLRGAAGISRLWQIGAAVPEWTRDAASAARWARSPQRSRRLALTITVTWPDNPDAGGDPGGDQHADAAAPRRAPWTGVWRVPAGS